MTRRADDPTDVPDLLLERYRLGEMTPAEKAAFDERLETDHELRRRLQALDESDEEIRRQYPPAILAAQVRQRFEARAAGTGRGLRPWMLGMPWKTIAGLAAALLLVVLVAPPLWNPPGGRDLPAGGSDRIKGLDPALLLFRKTADGSEPLEDGATARQGDLIRIGYRAAGQAYGLILSVDGRGVVTLHLPRDGGQPARLSTESQVLLDYAYELDDAPRWERFYFVTGLAPFDPGPVIEAANRVAASGSASLPAELPLGADVKQSSVMLVKDAPSSARATDHRFHVRALDACASNTVEHARRRSETIRRLQEGLAASDVVAYVRCEWLEGHQPQGALVWMSRAAGRRFVMIRLSRRLSPGRRMELLGHELQHAAEVAGASWVHSETDMSRLFVRIGRKTSLGETYETAAAKSAELAVRRDLFAPVPVPVRADPDLALVGPPPGPDAAPDMTLATVLFPGASSPRPAKR